MQFICYEMSVSRDVEDAYSEWRRSIPKEPGHLLLFEDVVATPVGTKMRCSYPTGFLPFLKAKRISFKVEGR